MKLTIDYPAYLEKIYAGWMGKSLGGTIAVRVENHKVRMHLTRDQLWPEKICANDDLDIQLVWLEAMQERGIWITSQDLADYWQDRCWYNFCEYGVFLNNVQRGIAPPLSGTWNNRFFSESEGCPIRSEIWGMVCPGHPELAAHYAQQDGQLDHGGASVHCEMFLSAAAAAAFFESDIDRVIDAGLAVLPAANAVVPMVAETRRICAAHPNYADAWRLLVRRFGDRDASKALMNQSIVIMALTLGRGNFDETIRLATNSGWDADCTAATAGALLGIAKGNAVFPRDWVEKMGRHVTCAIAVKHKEASFDQITEDTARLGVEIARLRRDDLEIRGAPAVPLRPRPAPSLGFAVEYPSGPWLRAAQNTPVQLRLTNPTAAPLTGQWRIEAPARLALSSSSGQLTLAAGETATLEILVAPQPGPLWDRNLLTLHWAGAAGHRSAHRFGLGGARLWRVYGPYWDMWDARKDPVCPHNQGTTFGFPPNGDSWNHYARLEHPYLDEARLLREDIPGELPEQIQLGEDYLGSTDLSGFRGQACFYLVREIVAESPTEIRFNITSNAPHAVWFDGRELARREQGREICLQDGEVGPMTIGPTPKRLVIKVARQQDALALLVAPVGAGDPTRLRGVSMFTDCLGDLPLR